MQKERQKELEFSNLFAQFFLLSRFFWESEPQIMIAFAFFSCFTQNIKASQSAINIVIVFSLVKVLPSADFFFFIIIVVHSSIVGEEV